MSYPLGTIRMTLLLLLLLAGSGEALLSPTSAAEGPKTGSLDWTPATAMKVKPVGGVQVSPDGKRVAFTVRQPVMDGDRSEDLTQIHLVNADGSEHVQLTRDDKSSDNPQWAPDGEWIAFTSTRSGKNNIWLIRPKGGEAQRLSDVPTGVSSFKWSPDS